MKSKAVICAIAAASLGFGSLSFAQGYDRRGPGGEPQRYEQRAPDRSFDHRDWRDGRDGGNFDRREARNDRYFGARGPEFRRGGQLPGEYRGHQYVVNDWRGHRLAPPQRGQEWVQVGADYALIAIATGLIAQWVLH